jgi:hypothetical protein
MKNHFFSCIYKQKVITFRPQQFNWFHKKSFPFMNIQAKSHFFAAGAVLLGNEESFLFMYIQAKSHILTADPVK